MTFGIGRGFVEVQILKKSETGPISWTFWKFCHDSNCSASRGLPSDAEQFYPEWRDFQFAPNKHYGFFFLHNLPSTIAFRLEYVFVYQFYAEQK